jgi:shikimate dehydrogenase
MTHDPRPMNHDPRPTTYGIIGFPLGHTFSPAYFAAKFAREGIDAAYEVFPLERIEDFPALLAAHPKLRGLNVTTPHKQAVMPYLHELSEDARAIGAVNCITIKEGRLTGCNADWTGFRDSLQPLLQPHHTSALVLGNGGASLAVRYALRRMNIPFHTVSATAGKADFLYRDITPAILLAHSIIINTTILGTLGKGCPQLPYNALTPEHLLFDLVYNPAVTPFLEEGLKRGALIRNGQEMLERQAEASWELWQ